jgi:RNA polymerase sigma-70 factor, ECF subfamily
MHLSDDDADRANLASVADRDQDALRRLYETYYPRLWRYLWYALAEDAALTEEVIQDCFLAIWHSAHTFRGDAKVATWIFQIAHNRAVNARRSQGQLPTTPFAATTEIPGDASLEEMVLDRLMLDDALARLAPMHQTVLNLFCYQGFSLAEIAAILRVPVGTVKSRLNHARRALLAHLGSATPQEN